MDNDLLNSQWISFNGINGETGTYISSPMTIEQFIKATIKHPWDEDHFNDLRAVEFNKQQHYRTLPWFKRQDDLKSMGWGLIFPAQASPSFVDRILSSLDPLIRLREEQMGRPACIYRGEDGFRWMLLGSEIRPEAKNDWLARHGAGPGSVDPTIVPYYLLIVADPQSIPFEFQYELDVEYAVGRIYFSTLIEFNCYARSVVEAERGGGKKKRRSVFFGTAHPGDLATELSAKHLVKPLYDFAGIISSQEGMGWESILVDPVDASRETLQSLLGGENTPAFLFTATHGMQFNYTNPDQQKYQGSLLCQDWGGMRSGMVNRQHYLAAEDIPEDHNLLGSIIFHFGCFSVGTPYYDEFSIALNQGRKRLASSPFLSNLPNRLLSHPNGGALAIIGHIDRAWSYSFQWKNIEEQTSAFQGILYQLMSGMPIGLAMESMNSRYADIACSLSNSLQKMKFIRNPSKEMLYKLAFEYTANNDSRGYAILGDPAVKLSFIHGEENHTPIMAFPQVDLINHQTPVVMDPMALKSLQTTEQLERED